MYQVVGKIEVYFHVKAFALTFAALLLLFILSATVFGIFFAKPEPVPEITGKVLATITAPLPEVAIEEKHETKSTPDTTTETAQEELPEIVETVDGLSEDSTFGPLPIIRESDGLKAFDAYKAPFTLKGDTKGTISLVMTDFGLSEKMSDMAASDLPYFVSLIASPYADNLQSKISAARNQGKEIWMQLPIESAKKFAANDAGPISLMTGLNEKQNTFRLNTALGHATGYVGVAFTSETAFTSDSKELQSVISHVNQRGLGITQIAANDTTIATLSEQTKTPFIQGHAIVDKALIKPELLKALSELEKESLNKGYAVGVFSPSPIVIETIAEWKNSLKEKSIQLAPLTYAIHQKNLVPLPK